MASFVENKLVSTDDLAIAASSDDGTLDPLVIFPKEVWCMIFANLSYVDLTGCMQANSTLCQLIKKERSRYSDYLHPDVLESIVMKLGKRAVSNMRLVCRTWKRGVDHLIQNAPLREDAPDKCCGLATTFSQQYLMNPKIDQFVQEMGSTVVNPFPGRMISLKDVSWSTVNLLLQRFGTEVWHLQFIRNKCLKTIEKYMKENLHHIRSAFVYLINLKTLVINGIHIPDGPVNINCAGILRLDLFPVLENLQILDVWDSAAPSFVNGILKACPNLRRLMISDHNFDHNYVFPKLEFLKVGTAALASATTSLQCPVLKIVELFRNAGWKSGNLAAWLNNLKQFAESVEHLKLLGIIVEGTEEEEDADMENAEMEFANTEIAVLEVEFPRLKKIFIEYYNGSSVSHLATIPSLMHLKLWSMQAAEGNAIREELQSDDQEIWQRMPNLETIHHTCPTQQKEGNSYAKSRPTVTVAKRKSKQT